MINIRWETLTTGSREVGKDVYHRGSGDNTETYRR